MANEDEVPPWEKDEGGFVLTFKAGRGYEDSWLVIRDKSVGGLRRRLMAAFEWTPQDIDGLSLMQLVNNATQQFQALGAVRGEFPATTATAAASAAPAGKSAWDGLKPQTTTPEPVDPNALILARIDEVLNVDALRLLWAESGPFTGDVEVAWKAKGKSLNASGK